GEREQGIRTAPAVRPAADADRRGVARPDRAVSAGRPGYRGGRRRRYGRTAPAVPPGPARPGEVRTRTGAVRAKRRPPPAPVAALRRSRRRPGRGEPTRTPRRSRRWRAQTPRSGNRPALDGRCPPGRTSASPAPSESPLWSVAARHPRAAVARPGRP